MIDDETHLSQISTQWSLVEQAHQAEPAARPAQERLLTRYYPAVYRFLRHLTGDAEAAQDLGQDFAVRFLRGDFRHARPEHGRFRDYLKAALRHLTADAHRRRLKAAHLDSLPGLDPAAPDVTEGLTDFWRRELLNRAWEELGRESAATGSLRYEALRLKSEDPGRDSAAVAAELSRRHGRPFTTAGVRQLLHRARERFAELLRREVAATLPDDDPAAVRAELAELRLLCYCEPGK
jgi:RNA polymerase sigma factor (sigma-70 family)